MRDPDVEGGFYNAIASPLNRVRLMTGKAVPEIERQALIQQDLHTILASRASFASSSDWTAISRVTMGNC